VIPAEDRQGDRATVPEQAEPRLPPPIDHRADPRATETRGRLQIGRKRKQKDVVLPSSQGELLRIALDGAAERGETSGDRQRLYIHLGPHPALPGEPRKIEGQAIRKIDRGGAPLPAEPAADFQVRLGQEVAAHGAAGRRAQPGEIEIRRQMDTPAREARASGDHETAGRRFADGPRKPQRVAGSGPAAGEEATAPRTGPQESQGRARRLRMARQVAPREPNSEAPAGGKEGVEKSPVIEIRRRCEGEKGIGGLGSGRRQVRKIDRKETPGEGRGGKLGRKMNAGDLTVHGDGKGAGRQERGVVAQERLSPPTFRSRDPAAEPGEQPVLGALGQGRV
jgi:hypothetical protein